MTVTSRINLTLPGYLFELKEKQRTGLLTINPGFYEKKFSFLKGELAVVKKHFPEQEFVSWLMETGHLEPPLRTSQQLLGAEIVSSVVGVIIEHGLMSAEKTLNLVREFYVTQLSELISISKVNFDFLDEDYSTDEILLDRISTVEVIANGVRKINNIEYLRDCLPENDSIIRRNTSADISGINLLSSENYLLNLLASPMTMEKLLRLSWLGPSETKKVLFLLGCLKLVELDQQTSEEPSRNLNPDMEGIFESFNEKHMLIYKYMAKQLGPVAFNLIEKCYHEIREILDPIFQNLEIRPDGSFELRPMLRFSLNDLDPREKKVLMRGFDEIILAALLMVRKNLGSRHEEAVIRILKRNDKSGDLS